MQELVLLAGFEISQKTMLYPRLAAAVVRALG
jgi:hypothetical protein